MSFLLWARGGLDLPPMLAPGLVFLVLALGSVTVSAQAPLRLDDGGFVCTDDAPPCSTPGMCTDAARTCEFFGDDYYRCVDLDNDVLCCSDSSQCPGGRCVGGFGTFALCVYDREDPTFLCSNHAPSDEALMDCFSYEDAVSGEVYGTARYGDGDCDKDGVLNAMDACDCLDGMGEADGCPPNPPDAGAGDGGIGDGGVVDGGTDGATGDGGGPQPDSGTTADSGNSDAGDFRGEGGCECSATRPAQNATSAALAALVGLFLFRRRRNDSD